MRQVFNANSDNEVRFEVEDATSHKKVKIKLLPDVHGCTIQPIGIRDDRCVIVDCSGGRLCVYVSDVNGDVQGDMLAAIDLG